MANGVKVPELQELIEKWCELKKYYHFEMERGVQRVEDLFKTLGYESTHAFLMDNPGAIGAIIEWISEQRLPEWREKLEASIGEIAPQKYEILDWTGKNVYPDKTFESTIAASDFLTEDQHKRHPNATDKEFEAVLGEFSVEPVEE